MKLDKHIERLLLTESIVVVPDFGCFVVHDMPAHYDAQEGVFVPAARKLGFTTQGMVNDYLLVQSYANHHDLSLPDAFKALARDVDALKAELFSTGKYRFEGVGVLYFSDNKYDFQPAFASLMTPSSYGFDALEIRMLKQQRQNVFAKGDEEPIVITIQRATVRRCATAAAVLALAVLSAFPVKYASHTLQQTQMASVVSLFNRGNITAASDDVKTAKVGAKSQKNVAKDAEAKDAAAQTAKGAAAPKKASLAAAPEEKGAQFTIVLAAGISQKGAEMYAEELRKEGVGVSITEGKSPQVVFGKFATTESARKEIAKHADNPKFSVAWIKKI